MRFFWICLLLAAGFDSSAQFRDAFPQPGALKDHPAYATMISSYKSGDLAGSNETAIELRDRYPASPEPYSYIANTLYLNKKYREAAFYYDAAFNLDPLSPAVLENAILGAAYNLDYDRLSAYFRHVSFLPLTAEERQHFEKYIDDFITRFSPLSNYQALTRQLQQGLQYYRDNYPKNTAFYQKYALALDQVSPADSKNGKGKALYRDLLQLKQMKDQQQFPPEIYYYLAGNLALVADPATFNAMLPELYAALADQSVAPLGRYVLYRQMIRHFDSLRDHEATISASTILLSELAQYSASPALYYEALYRITEAFLLKKDLNQAGEYARTLEKYLPAIKEQTLRIRSYNTAAAAISYSDKTKALALFNEALSYIRESGWSATYLASTEANKANHTGNGVTNPASGASATSLLNEGMMLIGQDKFEAAITPLRKAKQKTGAEMATAPPAQQKGMLALYSQVCKQLLGCLGESRPAAELIPVIEDMKSCSLAEATAGQKTKRASLAEIQAVLRPDEALIYYMDISGDIDDGYYIGVLVTRDKVRYGHAFAHNSYLPMVYAGFSSQIGDIEKELAAMEFRQPVYTRYNSPEAGKGQKLKQGEMGLLIECYRRNLSPAPGAATTAYNTNFAKGIGLAFYDALLSMFMPDLSGKKHLIFSLDEELNYLPFETLLTPDKRFLVQQYDISYISSGTVLRNIRQRKAGVYPKNVLAFGDAKYAPRAAAGYPLRSQSDVERVKFKVQEALLRQEHLDEAFATFSKSAPPYLIGTKKEVESIQAIVPQTDVYLDRKMTEQEFKQLNTSGALNDYKVIHLSSHASVHPYVFDLSGIMFSVFPKPVGNEDGVLVVSEVSRLKMRPELVMLSACQTGLGKLVPGDGVAGLNQAFLSAGAAATLTSLWCVSDYATSVLVSRFYTKVFSEKKDYLAALCEVKREFINSTDPRLNNPASWAPFIYTGK